MYPAPGRVAGRSLERVGRRKGVCPFSGQLEALSAEMGVGPSYEWEVRRWRPALQKVSLHTGARAEPARNGVFVALSALVPGMGKEGMALCCEK